MKKVSLQDIAERAGVSKTTVSAVLNNHSDQYGIRLETQRKVKEIAKQLNYTPNKMARGLRLKKTQTIGLVAPDPSNWFFSQLSASLRKAVGEAGYHLYIASSNYDEEEEYTIINDLLAWHIDGLIVASIMKNDRISQNVAPNQVPLVYIDRQFESDTISWVASDNMKATYDLVSYLCSTGVQEVGYLGGERTISTFHYRLAGYRQALEDQGIRFNPGLVLEQGFTASDGYQLIKTLVAQRNGFPEAVFTASCEFMVGVLEFIKETSRHIPTALKIGTYDNNELLDFLPVNISSVQQNTDQMAQAAFELLKHAMTGRQHIQHQMIPAQVIIRS